MKKFRKIHWFFKTIGLFIFISLFCYLIIVFLPEILPTQIVTGEIRGIIFQNQVWKKEIIISGDLITLPNVKVIIEPGTKVVINKSGDKNNLDVLPWHLKNGINTGLEERGILKGEPFWDEKEKIMVLISNIYAKGEGDRITMMSSGDGSPYDVNLIKIWNGEISEANFSNYRRLEVGRNVIIKNSSFENTGDCSICISSGNPLIEGNIFKKNKKNYINISNSSPLIKKNKFLEGEGDGILIESSRNGAVRIFENQFQIPSKKSIIVQADLPIYISENDFGLGDIELPCRNQVRLINNIISGKIIFKNVGTCSGEYKILENYWEILNSESILNARIQGVTDKFKVEIPRILKNPPE